jgi:hypothetical protein
MAINYSQAGGAKMVRIPEMICLGQCLPWWDAFHTLWKMDMDNELWN